MICIISLQNHFCVKFRKNKWPQICTGTYFFYKKHRLLCKHIMTVQIYLATTIMKPQTKSIGSYTIFIASNTPLHYWVSSNTYLIIQLSSFLQRPCRLLAVADAQNAARLLQSLTPWLHAAPFHASPLPPEITASSPAERSLSKIMTSRVREPFSFTRRWNIRTLLPASIRPKIRFLCRSNFDENCA